MARTKKRVVFSAGCKAEEGERDIFRWVTTGRAVTYGGVLNNEGGCRIGLPFPTIKASFRLRNQASNSTDMSGIMSERCNYSRFLDFPWPLVSSVPESAARFQTAKNTSFPNYIVFLVLRML